MRDGIKAVDPEFIKEQRVLGWPDMHPEDHCHRCGMPNPLWHAIKEQWAVATAKWAAETGREGICCPKCFQEMYEEAMGCKTQSMVVLSILSYNKENANGDRRS